MRPDTVAKFKLIYRIDSLRGKKSRHCWLLNIQRTGAVFRRWFGDNGDPAEALREAVVERDIRLKSTPPPYWCIRPSGANGVFLRTRGKKTVVTVHVPEVLQAEVGSDTVDHYFDPKDAAD